MRASALTFFLKKAQASKGAIEMEENFKDYNFFMHDITEKEFAKIFLHLKAHQKEIKIVNSSSTGVTLELDKKYILTYVEPKKEILVSTHPDNVKKLKEMLYHFMACTCDLDKAVNKSNTFMEALEILGTKQKEAKKK